MDDHTRGRGQHTPHPLHSAERFRGTFVPKALPVRSILTLVLVLTSTSAFLPAKAQQLEAKISPVTDATLANPPPQDWLMWRRTLDSWGYSPLKQINADN